MMYEAFVIYECMDVRMYEALCDLPGGEIKIDSWCIARPAISSYVTKNINLWTTKKISVS